MTLHPSTTSRAYYNNRNRNRSSSRKDGCSKGKRSVHKSRRERSIGVHSGFSGSEMALPRPEATVAQHDDNNDGGSSCGSNNNVHALLLVGRRFEYVTRKGERKNYEILSYLPWNGTHRVKRFVHDFDTEEDENCRPSTPNNYKTKLIDLKFLSNIRWLDESIVRADMDGEEEHNNNHDGSDETRLALANPLRPTKQTKQTASSEPSASIEAEEGSFQSPIPSENRKRKRILSRSRSVSPLPSNSPASEEEVEPSSLPIRRISGDASSPDFLTILPASSPSNSPSRKQRKKKSPTTETKKLSTFIESCSEVLAEEETLLASNCNNTHEKLKTDLEKHNRGSSSSNVIRCRKATNRWKARCLRTAVKETPSERTRMESEAEQIDRSSLDNGVTLNHNRSKWGKNKWKARCNQMAVKENLTPLPVVSTDSSSSPSTERKSPAIGDRIACSIEKDNTSLHFGTLTDSTSSNLWTVSFDSGEALELNEGEASWGLVQYETFLRREETHPIPTSSFPEVGDRTAFDFGTSGIHLGSIQGCAENRDVDEPGTVWTVAFDDGDVLELESSEIFKGRELYREIRREGSIKPLPESQSDTDNEFEHDDDDDAEGTVSATASISDQRLRGVKEGDRLAYDFGDAGVFFGSVDESYGCDSKSQKDWQWDVTFDDGDCYEFNSSEMATGIALYDEIRETERNDPSAKEKVRKWREEHAAEKKLVLAKVPQRSKDRFLEVGFGRWGKTYLPALFLGPYDVSPGTVREEWLEAFGKVSGVGGKKTWQQQKIPQIVYWFGATPDKGFSILEESDCLSLEDAGTRGLLKPKTARSKVALKHNHALKKLEEAMGRPKDRSRLGLEVREVHERVVGPKADRLLAEIEAAKTLDVMPAVLP